MQEKITSYTKDFQRGGGKRSPQSWATRKREKETETEHKRKGEGRDAREDLKGLKGNAGLLATRGNVLHLAADEGIAAGTESLKAGLGAPGF